jgi:hypothetical protein
MRFKRVLNESYKIILVLTVISSLVLATGPRIKLVSANPAGLYNYEFTVDKEGFTTVNIVYTAEETNGSSWVLLPKFTDWVNNTIRGTVTGWSLRDSGDVANGTFRYFYEELFFSFKSDNAEFQMDIQYNISTAAMIIEPDGIFYSPQIGFELGNKLETTVIFPSGFRVNEGLAYSLLPDGSSNSYSPSSTNQTSVVFSNIPETENLIRIEIGFNSANKNPDMEKITNGIFTFETVSRYAEYARSILDLYNRTYNDFVDLFNVTLTDATVRFFIPDFESLFTIGGYVPFTANGIGDININFVFTRSIEGYIEVIALHELVHHFLWKAGISPQGLLWFHEGMAQYVSMEIANRIGFEGAKEMINEMETSISQLKDTFGEDLGFLQQWSMTNQPQDEGSCYTAAYYMVRSLAENHGGLAYYARFFRLMHGETITSNSELGYYLSLASEESVATYLNSRGFNVPDLYLYSPLLGNVKKVLDEVNPLYQPYKYLAELLYEQALFNAKQESVSELHFYLSAALIAAKLAPLLTTITVSGVLFTIILLLLKRRGVFWNY